MDGNENLDPALLASSTNARAAGSATPQRGTPALDVIGLLSLPGTLQPPPTSGRSGQGGDEDVEGDDELLPAMADDDYSAQLSWQSQSKDNLKVLMDNFSPAQYDRFEAYRRHALPKQAVRKVIQQTLGQQVSQPVAQIIAGFSKVFVGEIVEKARAVQTRRGESGPLSPDHLREAYRAYAQETGHVGAARPLRSKKLFVR
ncbi:hTAFII28-like protein conserved region-domain-containing protein [Crassisporium funariophilum]|nr:hTAFII28-like protein conserved region-domain-containing protein [Crassisporium funariophilum]